MAIQITIMRITLWIEITIIIQLFITRLTIIFLTALAHKTTPIVSYTINISCTFWKAFRWQWTHIFSTTAWCAFKVIFAIISLVFDAVKAKRRFGAITLSFIIIYLIWSDNAIRYPCRAAVWLIWAIIIAITCFYVLRYVVNHYIFIIFIFFILCIIII